MKAWLLAACLMLFAAAAARHGGWTSVACCPGDNVGPILSAHQQDMGPWQKLIAGMLRGDLGPSFQYPDYTVAQLNTFRDGTRANSTQMTQVAAKLNDKEIKAVADYIAGLR
mgnify:CR=1 FL=1